jgi:hypothetical protein
MTPENMNGFAVILSFAPRWRSAYLCGACKNLSVVDMEPVVNYRIALSVVAEAPLVALPQYCLSWTRRQAIVEVLAIVFTNDPANPLIRLLSASPQESSAYCCLI